MDRCSKPGFEITKVPAGTQATVLEIAHCPAGAVLRVQAGGFSGYLPETQTHDLRLPPLAEVVKSQGEARPKGRFLIRRGNDAWLVELANPRTAVKIWSGAGRWAFVDTVVGTDGLTFYFAEATTDDGRSVAAQLTRVKDAAREPLFTVPAVPSEWLVWTFAISQDGRQVAYTDRDGVHLRNLPSGADTLVAINERSGCPDGTRKPDYTACFRYFRLAWSPNGVHLLAERIEYEPVQAYLFDTTKLLEPGRRLRFLPRSVLAQTMCTDDGDHYHGYSSSKNLIIHDFLSDSARPLDPPADVLYPDSCHFAASGEVASSWVVRSVPGYGPTDLGYGIARLYGSGGEALLTARIPGPGAVYGWVPDLSGVVVETDDERDRFGRRLLAPTYFLDRDGAVWNLPLEADQVLAILP